MKILCEVELEIDGEYFDYYKEQIIDAFLDNPHWGVWEINDDLAIIKKSMTVELKND